MMRVARELGWSLETKEGLREAIFAFVLGFEQVSRTFPLIIWWLEEEWLKLKNVRQKN
jgi:hypothetical protein